MAVATLTIDLNSLVENWRALDAVSADAVETAAVVKADGYGLDAGRVAAALAKGGAKTFFVAVAEEGVAVRKAVGAEPEIYVFSGCCGEDAALLNSHDLIPLLNSPEQVYQFLPSAKPFGIQLDSGMNRLGMEPEEFAALKDQITGAGPKLVMSHLACADEPEHPQNKAQLDCFRAMTEGLTARKSLSATGGTLLGADYHFDLNRPGVGLYGGAPFVDAKAVVRLSIPVIQTRTVREGETVGYGANWTAQRDSKVATIASGYADGLIRGIGNGTLNLYAGDTPCPLIGRVSMDLITVDVTDLDHVPDHLDLLNDTQTVDHLADAAGTIGYEILTSLGARYNRVYKG
ncbi:alanine racemase [Neptunicoccus cionae]|uniref:Alanine racemase n=1 Tax=Neptunicoccus cionae TaxID=2035344 RepID=A0A916QYX4_9RHOB|nr:alanine racemase [Amylibacter cionae]GGA21548.1 alanine racemase [Amylibacter cionae]